MSPLFEGLPAVIYSGLWVLKTYRRLEKTFPNSIEIAYLLTDSPPAFSVKIEKGNFDIKILENVKDINALEKVKSDGYLALSTETLYKGAMGIRDGINDGSVKMKNMESITLVAKLTGGY